MTEPEEAQRALLNIANSECKGQGYQAVPYYRGQGRSKQAENGARIISRVSLNRKLASTCHMEGPPRVPRLKIAANYSIHLMRTGSQQ